MSHTDPVDLLEKGHDHSPSVANVADPSQATQIHLLYRGRNAPGEVNDDCPIPIAQRLLASVSPRRADMFTRSASEVASIFRITRPRCTFTVISPRPSSNAICLLR